MTALARPCRPRLINLLSPPTKADFNLDLVFPNPPPMTTSPSSRRLKPGSSVGTAFVHLHPSDSRIGSHSHLLSLSWHMSVFDAELYPLAALLSYAASLFSFSKVVSLGSDN